MDIKQQIAKPSSDDQELAKVLSGVDDAGSDSSTTDLQDNLVPEPSTPPPSLVADDAVLPSVEQPVTLPPVDNLVQPSPVLPTIPVASGLDGVKQDALRELRPLVDKLTLAPEEKFDTYLLLIRSTDDSSLIAPAHEAAKQITDEARRAQALLDIIKEIDFLSGGQAQVA